MTPQISTSHDAPHADIKQVPQEPAVRQAIRSLAAELSARIDPARPPSRDDLEQQARTLLDRLGQSPGYLGFAMVSISNAFWLTALQGVPHDRRLFLLPHCLSDKSACAGTYDSVGLNCAGCGRCSIHELKSEAERLGYQVIVAEGTSSVLMKVLEGDADAIIGVACLDSLEKSFHRIVELGVPHMAVPLLRDGCVDTEAELDQIRALLLARSDSARPQTRSYVPLLRETMGIFQEPLFSELLAPCLPTFPTNGNGTPDALNMVPHVAIEWLREGGKRLRPFVTVVAYAVAKHGIGILSGTDVPAEGPLPLAVKRLALAIEALHKASLVHDDIEDEDEFRYGRQTLHRVHGIGPAVNVGDYLIGVGYRLISNEGKSLGADFACDILASLSNAHLELCRGQGTELLWQKQPDKAHRPLDVLTIYALKTAPAFEAALYAGLRAAGAKPDADLLRQFSCCLGEAFQIMNDLEDWRADDRNKLTRGRDAILGRPTILRAFATEADTDGTLAQLAGDGRMSPTELANCLGEFYERSGAMARAEQLLGKLRSRALACAARFDTTDLQELMAFLVRLVLPEQAPTLPPGHP